MQLFIANDKGCCKAAKTAGIKLNLASDTVLKYKQVWISLATQVFVSNTPEITFFIY